MLQCHFFSFAIHASEGCCMYSAYNSLPSLVIKRWRLEMTLTQLDSIHFFRSYTANWRRKTRVIGHQVGTWWPREPRGSPRCLNTVALAELPCILDANTPVFVLNKVFVSLSLKSCVSDTNMWRKQPPGRATFRQLVRVR